MTKTIVMLVALASVLGLGSACFGLFSSDDEKTVPAECRGLEGQALADCEAAARR
jgi:hypothetical protein